MPTSAFDVPGPDHQRSCRDELGADLTSSTAWTSSSLGLFTGAGRGVRGVTRGGRRSR
jgi:hypothetical protein